MSISGDLDSRAHLTTQAEAFRSPDFLGTYQYEAGFNSPSIYELEYAQTLRDLGRSDLAEHVEWDNIKYRRLNDLLQFDNRDVRCLEALRRAFVGCREDPLVQTRESLSDWLTDIRYKSRSDETLRRLTAEEIVWTGLGAERDVVIRRQNGNTALTIGLPNEHGASQCSHLD